MCDLSKRTGSQQDWWRVEHLGQEMLPAVPVVPQATCCAHPDVGYQNG